MRRSRRAMFREISEWHCPSIHSDGPSSARRLKISRENQELEVVEGDELAQCGNKSRSGTHASTRHISLVLPNSHHQQ